MEAQLGVEPKLMAKQFYRLSPETVGAFAPNFVVIDERRGCCKQERREFRKGALRTRSRLKKLRRKR